MFSGYPPGAAWELTPREIAAWIYYADKRDRRKSATSLVDSALAAHGNGNQLKKRLSELQERL